MGPKRKASRDRRSRPLVKPALTYANEQTDETGKGNDLFSCVGFNPQGIFNSLER